MRRPPTVTPDLSGDAWIDCRTSYAEQTQTVDHALDDCRVFRPPSSGDWGECHAFDYTSDTVTLGYTEAETERRTQADCARYPMIP